MSNNLVDTKRPYIDPDIISLNIGSDQTFYVHRPILSQSTVLDAKPGADKTISLPDLDEDTAHTLVHYLYTRKYQTLKSHASDKEGSISGYKLGVCVYCAATRYKLPGLAELAKQKIQSFGEDLSVLEILVASRENMFAELPDDEVWFNTYLEDAIKSAVSENPELFTKAGLLDQIVGNRKLLEIVMKAMVNTYSRGPNVASEQQTGRSTPVAAPASEAAASTEVVELENFGLEPIEPVESEENQIDEAAISKDVPLQDTAIASSSPQSPEPFTDELGYSQSTTYQKLGKNGHVDTDAISNKAPSHRRNDSVIDTKDIMSSISTPTEEKTVASQEPADADSKKKNKRKKKKNAANTTTGVEA